MVETLIQILSELKNMRIDINELIQGQQNLEAGQKRMKAQQTFGAGLDRVENGVQTFFETVRLPLKPI